jgi:pimeloyl-ACP methyl ester carboxylesterase
MTLAHDVAGAGPDVLLIHNGLCDRRMWDRQMRSFADSYRVIRCDLPGYGDMPEPEGPFSCAEDVLALLDELAVGRAALVGNSLGGRVALDVCLAAPERVSALVLVAPGRGGWDWSETARDSWRRQEEAAEAGDLDLAVELSLQLWLDGPLRPAGAVGGDVRAGVAAMQRRALENELAATSPAGPERRPEGSPADVRVPTLVLVGDLDLPDLAAIAESYEREIPGARRIVMHGAAHVPSLEQPEEFDRLVLDFLREAHLA